MPGLSSEFAGATLLVASSNQVRVVLHLPVTVHDAMIHHCLERSQGCDVDPIAEGR